jgi:porphobilinogen synthase
MGYPVQRLRRLRKNETLRKMVRESRITKDNLIYPLFAVHGKSVRKEIDGLPGNYHLSIDNLASEAKEVAEMGIPAILLFGLPEKKDMYASEAYSSDGIVQRAIKEIKDTIPELIVITDVCLCEYTSNGHCGIIKDGYLVNDQSLEVLEKVTISHADAGADMLAPAAMLDGQIKRMRHVLDQNGNDQVAIMAYSAKYASKLYDVFFKHGTDGGVLFGDKKTHQMDFSNSNEAMREIALDIEEGADIVMVKPGLFYLDILYRAKEQFNMPLAVYNVSGEFAMVKAASMQKRIDEEQIRMEIMTSFRRAGADMIITYHAKEIASSL